MKTVEIVFIFILIIDCILDSDTLNKALAKTCTLVLDNADREGKKLEYEIVQPWFLGQNSRVLAEVLIHLC